MPLRGILLFLVLDVPLVEFMSHVLTGMPDEFPQVKQVSVVASLVFV